MTTPTMPEWFDEYVVFDEKTGGSKLKEDAPEWVQVEYEKYLELTKMGEVVVFDKSGNDIIRDLI